MSPSQRVADVAFCCMQMLVKMVSFDKQNTDALKGISAIAILVCHLYARTGVGQSLGLGFAFTAFGYLAVSIFLALSGYGLAYSYNCRGGGYLHYFLRRRVLPIYILQCILIGLYAIVKFVLGKGYTVRDFVQSFFFGRTIVSNGWYLQVILLFYLIFYLSFKWTKRPACSVLIATTVYVMLCMVAGLDSTWYECTFCFDLGFLIFYERQRLEEMYRNRKLIIVGLALILILFATCFVLARPFPPIPEVTRICFKMASSVLFATCVLIMSNMVDLRNMVTRWLTEYYLEIYLFQGVVFLLCRNMYWKIANPYVYYLAAFAGTLFMAKLFHRPVTWIMEKVKG